jgi:hypothetical protein
MVGRMLMLSWENQSPLLGLKMELLIAYFTHVNFCTKKELSMSLVKIS